jgi:type II secretory pathway predicted ATPase ExeA
MYNSYFGFSDSPFENRLDQKFLFLSDDHREVLAALLYFLKEEKGFAIVCGDVGTGKTMLINSLLYRLPPSVRPINISNPNVLYLELLQYIARALEVQAGDKTMLELADEVKQALIAARKEGLVHVLIVDEAHLLSDASLEDIRLLSNMETREQRLLQILLVGQYELSHKLDRPEMRQLRQRINISRFLSPLNPDETIQYIDHRLAKVGAEFDGCFEGNCRNLIFKLTDGLPRRINQLCDNALLICMAEGLRKVNRRILEKAGEALSTDLLFTPKSVKGKNFLVRENFRKVFLPAVVGLALLLSGGIWSRGALWGKKTPSLPAAHLVETPASSLDTWAELSMAQKKIDPSLGLPNAVAGIEGEMLIAPLGEEQPAQSPAQAAGGQVSTSRGARPVPGEQRVAALPLPPSPLNAEDLGVNRLMDPDHGPVLTLGSPLPVGWGSVNRVRPTENLLAKPQTRKIRTWKPGKPLPRKKTYF